MEEEFKKRDDPRPARHGMTKALAFRTIFFTSSSADICREETRGEERMVDEEKEAKEPTFAELFEANPGTPEREFRAGDTVSGEVVKISNEAIFIELGGKSEGVADAAEFLDKEGTLTVKVGDRLELRVASVSDVVNLSRVLKVRGSQALEMIQDAHANMLPVEGRVAAVRKGGLEVNISGVRAFCPISQIDLTFCENPEEHVGARYVFRILEFKERGRNIVVSRRALLEEERERVARETLATLKPGVEREGQVTRLVDFGAFVDIGGVDGMVHISEMAHHRLRHPSELLQVGQKVRVVVTECEPKPDGRTRVALSMKALEPSPWEKGLGILEGQIVRGKVTRIMDFGAFVELTPGVEGLVHVSEISYEKVSHPRRVLQEGQEVEVRVLEIDQERHRISLSIKEAKGAQPGETEGPERKEESQSLQVGAQFSGVVEKALSGGLLVRLPGAGPGVRGFLPQEELAQTGRTDLRKRFPLGKEVSVAVVALEDDGKIRLSQRAATEREERKAYRRYVDQGDRKSAGFATLGDLFKDLKLPEKKS
jgi:small subunit ribosomal protein S1